jgi:hypothetical protein
MSRKLRLPDFTVEEVLQLFQTLGYNPRRVDQTRLLCKCPESHVNSDGTDKLVVQADFPINVSCTRHTDGVVGFWDYLSAHHGTAPYSMRDTSEFDGAIEFACRAAGVTPVARAGAKYDRRDDVRALYREIFKALTPIKLTASEPGYEILDGKPTYRGVTPFQWLGQHQVGMLGAQALKALTDAYPIEIWNDAGLNYSRDDSKLYNSWLTQGILIPRRDENNVIVSLTVRNVGEALAKRPDTKYAKAKKTNILVDSRSYLYNFGLARRTKARRVYLVEGEFDALMMVHHGIKNVVATGWSCPTDAQYARLQKLGLELTMIPDVDEAGMKAAVQFAETCPYATFLWLRDDTQTEALDPDLYLRSHTREDFLMAPLLSALAIRMHNEDTVEGGHLWLDPDGHTNYYLDEIAGNPSVYDRYDIEMLAYKSGHDVEWLQNAMQQIRSERFLNELAGAGAVSGLRLTLHTPDPCDSSHPPPRRGRPEAPPEDPVTSTSPDAVR